MRLNDWLIRMLQDYRCHRVILIQPDDRKKRKTDRRDAAALSELLWVNRGRLLAHKPVRGLRQVDIAASNRNRLRGRSIEDTISRLSIAERIFTAWHQTRGLAGGVTVQECFTDEGIEHLQDQLLAGAEGRCESRAPFTVNSIVKTVMTFARYCCRKKWIERLPHVDSIEHD